MTHRKSTHELVKDINEPVGVRTRSDFAGSSSTSPPARSSNVHCSSPARTVVPCFVPRAPTYTRPTHGSSSRPVSLAVRAYRRRSVMTRDCSSPSRRPRSASCTPERAMARVNPDRCASAARSCPGLFASPRRGRSRAWQSALRLLLPLCGRSALERGVLTSLEQDFRADSTSPGHSPWGPLSRN